MAVIELAKLCFLIHLFGPDPAIIVSPETTYVVSPLAADGLPDYFEALRRELKSGVTPENNAAALIWQIGGWPDETPEQRVRISAELGVERQESGAPTFEQLDSDRLRGETVAWLSEINWLPKEIDGEPLQLDDELPPDPLSQRYYREEWLEEAVGVAMVQPWTSEQFPTLAAWVERNAQALDIAVEASRRPRYYQAMTMHPGWTDSPVRAVDYAVRWRTRNLFHGLLIRAMRHTGEGRLRAAYNELIACRRLAELLHQTPTLFDQIVAIACDSMTLQSLQALAAVGGGSPELYADIRRSVVDFDSSRQMMHAIAHGERIAALDEAADWIRNPERYTSGPTDWTGGAALRVVRIDWGLVIERLNQAFALWEAGHAESDPVRFQQIKEDFVAQDNYLFSVLQNDMHFTKSFFLLRARSEYVLSRLYFRLWPAIKEPLRSAKRVALTTQLTQTAAALAEWRAIHGAYPQSLEELIPAILDSTPTDIFGEPLGYEVRGEGYLLYCAETRDEESQTDNTAVLDQSAADHARIFGYEEEAHYFSVRVPLRLTEWPSE